jgi:hypothetical protein
MSNKKIKSLLKKYLLHLIILFVLANASTALYFFSKAQNNSCMTQEQIDSDSRCLYVYHDKVYEMGSRSRPHKGHQCGMNVDSIIPNLHFAGSILSKFNNTLVSNYCTTPTQTATPQPTDPPTVAPTAPPTTPPTTIATVKPTTAPAVTPTSTATSVSTNTPTTPLPTATATSLPTAMQTLVPTQISKSYSGNTFGEILGRPKDQKNNNIETKNELNLTKISKPATYISLFGVIASILVAIIF